MKKIVDYQKEQYRGTLKQIMKVRGLRTISLANYLNWLRSNGAVVEDGTVHSLKLDLQDGYINVYGYGNKGKCGEKIEDADAETYQSAYVTLTSLLSNENSIPSEPQIHTCD